ncbi:hypothetical protein ACFLVB_05545 [Chloroflexota bacterium]
MLYGEDDFSLRQSLGEIKHSVGDETILAANTTILDGQKVTLDQLRGSCETVPFMAEKRLVIIEGLLGQFESAGRTGRKKTVLLISRTDTRQWLLILARYRTLRYWCWWMAR